MITNPKPTYVFLLILSLAACLYSYFKPGITPPQYPNSSISQRISSLYSPKVNILSSEDLKLDTSDRMLSKLYRYKFNDDSELLSLMVRVRKKDDFKIETYGLLTKDIPPIYIKSPSLSSSVPFTMSGHINRRVALQTCIIPGSKKLEQANVKLNPLVELADSFSGEKKGILFKLLGKENPSDYSCLVLTYFPSDAIQSSDNVMKNWISLISIAQSALANSGESLPARILAK